MREGRSGARNDGIGLFRVGSLESPGSEPTSEGKPLNRNESEATDLFLSFAREKERNRDSMKRIEKFLTCITFVTLGRAAVTAMTRLSERKTKLSFVTEAEVPHRGKMRPVVVEVHNGLTASVRPQRYQAALRFS